MNANVGTFILQDGKSMVILNGVYTAAQLYEMANLLSQAGAYQAHVQMEQEARANGSGSTP